MQRLIPILALCLFAILEVAEGLQAQGVPTKPSAPSKPQTHPPSDVALGVPEIDSLVVERREKEALAFALRILKEVPVGTDQSTDCRRHALEALKAFDALDEYQRKVQAYYKNDQDNLAYQKLMAEVLSITNPPGALSFLERMHAAQPDNFETGLKLACLYNQAGNDPALLTLLNSLVPQDFPRVLSCPSLDVIGTFERAQAFPKLMELYQKYLLTHENSRIPIMEAMIRKKIPTDSAAYKIAYYKQLSADDDRTVAWLDRGRLIELLAKNGDKDGVGEECEKLFFSHNRQPVMAGSSNLIPENTQLGALWNWTQNDPPYAPGLDVIRAARDAGQIERLKKRAKLEVAAHPEDAFLSDLLMLIVVIGRDPEALILLPDYLKNRTSGPASKWANAPLDALFVICGELQIWPEAKEWLKPTLQACLDAATGQQSPRSLDANRRLAHLALQMDDKKFAQAALRDSMADMRIGPNASKVTPVQLPFIQQVTILGHELINADMQDELQLLLRALNDETRTGQGARPDSRAEKIASLGESALDKGWTAQARLAAELAAKRIHNDWDDPRERSDGVYSITLNPKAVQLTCDLLLKLNMVESFDALYALFSQPNSANLDVASITADADRLRLMLGEHSEELTPGAWLDEKTEGRQDRTVHWDVATLTAKEGKAQDGLDVPTRYTENSRGNGIALSLTGRGIPQLDGKFGLQILAGPAANRLRVLKVLPGAKSRGTTLVTLNPDDRYLRAIGQTTSFPAQVFIGPILPISLGENLLLPAFTKVRPFYFDPLGGLSPLATNETVVVRSHPGGPVTDGQYQTVSCPSLCSNLELAWPPQKIVPGTTYYQCGWFKGPGQWGVNFLDDKGAKISTSLAASGGPDNEWSFVQQHFTIANAAKPAPNTVPLNAVSFEPFLSIGQGGTITWNGLYLGIEQQHPVEQLAERTAVMGGLIGTTSILEAPQGKILATAAKDGIVHCFDLVTHQELGTPLKLSAPFAGMGFINGGRTLVAANAKGDVAIRSVYGVNRDNLVVDTPPGTSTAFPPKTVYQAPWQIDMISGARDSSLIAIGNADSAQVIVIDTTTGKEVSNFSVGAEGGERLLVDVIISPDGKIVYTSCGNGPSRIWLAATGQQIPLPSHYLNKVAVARFFHVDHAMEFSYQQQHYWVQVKNGWSLSANDSSLIYVTVGTQENPHELKTGSLTAYCLSSQTDDVYGVDLKGDLYLWKLPDLAHFPDYVLPTGTDLSTLPIPDPVAPRPLLLVVKAPPKLRGFPDTTLSDPLAIEVLDNKNKPVADATLLVQSDLKSARFLPKPDAEISSGKTSVQLQTDQNGKAITYVHLRSGTGNGKISVQVSAQGLTQHEDVLLESINEHAPLADAKETSASFQGTTVLVHWLDESEGQETGFLIERQFENEPWQVIALVPEGITSYRDTTVPPDRDFRYQVNPVNARKYGYPAKLPPPPDRLGNFLP